MSKFVAQIAVAAAVLAAPLAAFAAAPAPVKLNIAAVDFADPAQVAAFKARVGEVQNQMCRSVPDKAGCRANILGKVTAQLNDSQKAAFAASASETVAAR